MRRPPLVAFFAALCPLALARADAPADKRGEKPAVRPADKGSGPAVVAAAPEGTVWAAARAAAGGSAASAAARGAQDFARLVQRLGPAVVNIQTLQGEADPNAPSGRRVRARGLGTGFFIHRRGYLLTNQHVVENADEIHVRLADERVLPAYVVGADERTDLALLKVDVPEDVPIAPLGDSDQIEIGEWVIAIGNPFGLDHTVTIGIVSGKGRRDVRPGGSTAGFFDFIQTDASINAGNSGGPLINARGEVVGINTAMNTQAQGIAFAIPINMVKTIVPLLRRFGRAPRSWLGASAQPLTQALRLAFGLPDTRGALVAEVAPGSPAQAAGLLSGDVVLDFDGHAIRRADDLEWLVSTAGAGREVAVAIRRGSELRVLRATLKPDPDEPKAPAAPPPPAHLSPLGMVVAELAPGHAVGARGVMVVQVEPGSPASEAGIERGDVLLRVGGTELVELEDYAKSVRAIPRGAIIKLLARRDGKSLWAAFEKR